MAFFIANRTDVLLDQNNNEIGWVYTTDEGDRIIHYIDGKKKSEVLGQEYSDNRVYTTPFCPPESFGSGQLSTVSLISANTSERP